MKQWSDRKGTHFVDGSYRLFGSLDETGKKVWSASNKGCWRTIEGEKRSTDSSTRRCRGTCSAATRKKIQQKYPDFSDGRGGTLSQKKAVEWHVHRGYLPKDSTFVDVLLHHDINTEASTTITQEVAIELQPLDSRPRWQQGTKQPHKGGPERTMGTWQAKLDREAAGLKQLANLYPAPHHIEDCVAYKKQVGADYRIWNDETLVARVDVKSGNIMTKPQLKVAFSSEAEGVPYFIFDPYTGKAMPITKEGTIVEWTVAKVYSKGAQ